MIRAVALLALLSLFACGAKGSQDSNTTPTDPAQAESATEGSEVPWPDKSEEQRKEHMKTVVVPHMKALFATAPEPPEKVNCAFCHGEGVREGKFDMPNQSLETLDPANDFAAHREEHGSTVEFMVKVEVEMAKALGVKPYDPSTHEGFGCFNCHPMKK